MTFFFLSAFSPSFAADDKNVVQASTIPLGSPFYRHLAFDFNLDMREMIKFEKKGFGHGEMVTLVLISKSSGTALKEYGKRRLKADVSLQQMAEEAGLNYETLYKVARIIKEGIEAKGDKDLPPPVFPLTPKEEEEKKKKEKGKKGEGDFPGESKEPGTSPILPPGP